MKSKMFPFITTTVNPLAMRCRHGCVYCWAEALKNGKLKNSPRYKDLSDDVVLIEKELHRSFSPDDFVFVEDMGDLFGDWVWDIHIKRVLAFIGESKARFLLLTKNPARMWFFAAYIPFRNTTVGITLETNRDTSQFSKAPLPVDRIIAFHKFASCPIASYIKRFVCIEPIMDFDLLALIKMVELAAPQTVAIGYDNYSKNALPEPSLAKTARLINGLKRLDIAVITKTLREKQS